MENVAAGRTAENSIFMLQTHHIDIVEVQKFSRVFIRLDVVLGERPSYPWGIVISFFGIIDRQCQQSRRSVLARYGRAQICRKCRDSTLSRKIIPNHRNSTW